MSSHLHVIANTKGSGDCIIVYDTTCGDVLFEGHSVGPKDLFELLDNGGYDKIHYHEMTDEQIKHWNDFIR
jgi:hypothetical protein